MFSMKTTALTLALAASSSASSSASSLPTVFMHGMGDSCFNPGMQQITAAVGNRTGTYAVCIPTGADQGSEYVPVLRY